MINTNKLYIKTKSGHTIDIELWDKTSIIMGDSATGKTMMLRLLKGLKKNKLDIIETSIDLDDIEICLDEESFYSKIKENISGKLIFVDRYNMVDSEKSRHFIKNSKNVFVLCTHKPTEDCGSSLDSILGLRFDKVNLIYKTYQLKNMNCII